MFLVAIILAVLVLISEALAVPGCPSGQSWDDGWSRCVGSVPAGLDNPSAKGMEDAPDNLHAAAEVNRGDHTDVPV